MNGRNKYVNKPAVRNYLILYNVPISNFVAS